MTLTLIIGFLKKRVIPLCMLIPFIELCTQEQCYLQRCMLNFQHKNFCYNFPTFQFVYLLMFKPLITVHADQSIII